MNAARSDQPKLGRRGWILLLAIGATLILAAVAWRVWESRIEGRWLPAFIAPMHEPIAGDPEHDDSSLRFVDTSLRQFVPLALPGSRIRLRLSNEFGEHALTIGELHVAWRSGASGAAIRPGSDRRVLFGGSPEIDIAPGSTVYSDSIVLPDGPRADLAVSLYLPNPTPRASWHLVGSRSSYRSVPGKHVDGADFPIRHVDRSIYFLAGVEVQASAGAGVWVAFGDSITDGAWHTVDADASWPARWAERWRAADSRSASVGVLNAGVGGNRLLINWNGPSGLERFHRDVLDLHGVRGVVLAIGINDLGGQKLAEKLPETVQRLIAAQTELAGLARERGLTVVGATLTPVQSSVYGRPEVEAARQQFNQWVRQSGLFDAVVDFDAVIRDPDQPQRIRTEWDGDHIHPNDAGYQAMGDAVVQVLEQAGLQDH